jgi:lactate dehydrogenase-like 2-hydroxyacid dehydrogenase
MELLEQVSVEKQIGGELPATRAELLAGAAGAAGVISMLSDKIDAEFFDAAGPQLKVVANLAVGFDNIDLAEAAQRGVVITNTPGVLDNATADLTFALLLAVTRRIVESDAWARAGKPWLWGPNEYVGLDVSNGTTLGIIGLGRIGGAVAKRAKAFDMRVIATAHRHEVGEVVDGVEIVELDTLLSEADVVSLHVPLTAANRHLIDAAAIAKMKRGSYLVNAARGGVVDELAVVAALESGQLAGAAFDVFEGEPNIRPELRARPDVVLATHIGSAGRKTRDTMGKLCIDNVLAVLSDQPALTPVE